MTSSIFNALRLILMACILFGCAVEQIPTQFAPLGMENVALLPERLDQWTEITLNTGYRRNLKPGSLWTHIGSLAQGQVYKPYHDVFTLEGSQVHEAYLVISGNTLTGFYLPAERSFSPLTQKISLTFSQ
jgi:hypothetical protein